MQVTKVSPEGYVTDLNGNIMGFKCLRCSTVHLLDKHISGDQIVDDMMMYIEMHKDC